MTCICNEFRTSSKALHSGTQKQAGNPVILIRTPSKHFSRYFEVLLKFNDDTSIHPLHFLCISSIFLGISNVIVTATF